MKTLIARLSLLLLLLGGPAAAQDAASWDPYLDYAYVFSSAEQPALRARLEQYAGEAGVPLDRHIAQRLMPLASQNGPEPEERVRRRAIAHLLLYLADGKSESLEESVEAANALKPYLGRHESRYWHHYVLAHAALERGRPYDFVGNVLDLWLGAVVPLETPYETLKALSLSESPNSGFASSLPFLYENVARLVLIRSQQMGVDRGLDPLGGLVRLLADHRVGAHPDVIPVSASSRDYLDRIVERLDGPESDAGSLTFTLALFEASKLHDNARGLIATQGLSGETVKAIRVAGAAYRTAADRADTVQGEAAVQTRVLRQLGEIYAAKQRLKMDPEIETPFTIEDAIGVYTKLAEAEAEPDGWQELGFRERDGYVVATRGLWEEIQEATLNAADYYLSRGVELPHLADDYSRNAVRLYTRYLSLFQKHALSEGAAGVPDSAYYAAHEAARGVGDAFLLYASHPTPEEVDLGIRRYRSALRIFPFDRTLWSSLTAALEKQGRESEYMGLVRPAAEAATRSRVVNRWVETGEADAERLASLQRAFADSLAVMYLGFADASGVGELERSLAALRTERQGAMGKLQALRRRLGGQAEPVPAAFDPDAGSRAGPLDAAETAEAQRELAEASALLERLDQQIEARSRTLPIYTATLASDGLGGELRARRDHPLHGLLRRLYHEERASMGDPS